MVALDFASLPQGPEVSLTKTWEAAPNPSKGSGSGVVVPKNFLKVLQKRAIPALVVR
jgi:hypothetical protein